MKYNLKNFPRHPHNEREVVLFIGDVAEWKRGFEAELRHELKELSNAEGKAGSLDFLIIKAQKALILRILGEEASEGA